MKINLGIASTTHIDQHGERMAKSALENMMGQIKAKYIPILINHDPNQRVGVILDAMVRSLNDGEFALCVVNGLFENEEEKFQYELGKENAYANKFYDDLGRLNIDQSRGSNHTSTQKDNRENIKDVAQLLEIYLDSTAIWTDGSVYRIKHLISSINDLKIHIFPKDHWPPHFHVLSNQRDINSTFNIETLELIKDKGTNIRKSDIKKVKSFLRENPDVLKFLRSEYDRMR